MKLFKRLRRHRKPRAYKRAFQKLLAPIKKLWKPENPLVAKGYRPLQMSFDDQLKALIFFHLEDFSSGRELLQALEQDNFAKECVAPPKGIKKSAFFEAINNRGLEQLIEIFAILAKQATKTIPAQYANLGNLVAIDGSYIDAVMSMDWADYSSTQKKAKAHIGFDINRGIPKKIVITDGNEIERQFVPDMIGQSETAVMDRGYQCNADFDQWQTKEKKFICRIQARSKKKVVRENPILQNSIIFYDAVVILGTKGLTEAEKEVRLIAYRFDGKEYWIATNRHDLTAEEVAQAYKLRWNIETFFAWWKRHLNVYHLIARSQYGLTVQIMGGLITYLLLAIYCQEQYNERVSISRVRELRHQISRDTAELAAKNISHQRGKPSKNRRLKKKRQMQKLNRTTLPQSFFTMPCP